MGVQALREVTKVTKVEKNILKFPATTHAFSNLQQLLNSQPQQLLNSQPLRMPR